MVGCGAGGVRGSSQRIMTVWLSNTSCFVLQKPIAGRWSFGQVKGSVFGRSRRGRVLGRGC